MAVSSFNCNLDRLIFCKTLTSFDMFVEYYLVALDHNGSGSQGFVQIVRAHLDDRGS